MHKPVPVTVAIGHFEDLLTRGLRGLIEDDPSLTLVACDVSHADLPAMLRARRPRVTIVDHASLGNPAEVRDISTAHPATRLVMLAEQLSSAECAQLLAFGAAACLSRATQSRDILNAVHLASRGMQLTPREFDGGASDSGVLTPREAEVLAELQRRRANAQIASDLHVSIETVRTHARNIYRKLGVSSRRELIAPQAPAAPNTEGRGAPARAGAAQRSSDAATPVARTA
jgi:DNA-binding NarL/FixJ family response regulator